MKKLAKQYRYDFNFLRDTIISDLIEVLKKAENNTIELDDVRGSLIFNTIDDQQSEVISEIYLKYDATAPSKARISVEVADGINGYDVRFEDLGIELMLNVADAVEIALNK
jgi:hypothetical protein